MALRAMALLAAAPIVSLAASASIAAEPAAGAIEVAEDQWICFGRAYRWDQVDGTPQRRVVEMRLSLVNWDGHLYFGFLVSYIDRSGLVFNAGGACHPENVGYMCAQDGDGGVIYIAPNDEGGVSVRGSEHGMRVYSSAYYTEDTLEEFGEYHPDGFDSFRTPDAMPVHHLVPLPPEFCN